eukprot:GHVN01057220.1.p1 GENE.GHVN01057220.1~~GHVN01057220.1.p1  ORF type:complete len:1032 (+),score=240.60 GHVN01057220.1:100-3195(+)
MTDRLHHADVFDEGSFYLRRVNDSFPVNHSCGACGSQNRKSLPRPTDWSPPPHGVSRTSQEKGSFICFLVSCNQIRFSTPDRPSVCVDYEIVNSYSQGTSPTSSHTFLPHITQLEVIEPSHAELTSLTSLTPLMPHLVVSLRNLNFLFSVPVPLEVAQLAVARSTHDTHLGNLTRPLKAIHLISSHLKPSAPVGRWSLCDPTKSEVCVVAEDLSNCLSLVVIDIWCGEIIAERSLASFASATSNNQGFCYDEVSVDLTSAWLPVQNEWSSLIHSPHRHNTDASHPIKSHSDHDTPTQAPTWICVTNHLSQSHTGHASLSSTKPTPHSPHHSTGAPTSHLNNSLAGSLLCSHPPSHQLNDSSMVWKSPAEVFRRKGGGGGVKGEMSEGNKMCEPDSTPLAWSAMPSYPTEQAPQPHNNPGSMIVGLDTSLNIIFRVPVAHRMTMTTHLYSRIVSFPHTAIRLALVGRPWSSSDTWGDVNYPIEMTAVERDERWSGVDQRQHLKDMTNCKGSLVFIEIDVTATTWAASNCEQSDGLVSPVQRRLSAPTTHRDMKAAQLTQLTHLKHPTHLAHPFQCHIHCERFFRLPLTHFDSSHNAAASTPFIHSSQVTSLSVAALHITHSPKSSPSRDRLTHSTHRLPLIACATTEDTLYILGDDPCLGAVGETNNSLTESGGAVGESEDGDEETPFERLTRLASCGGVIGYTVRGRHKLNQSKRLSSEVEKARGDKSDEDHSEPHTPINRSTSFTSACLSLTPTSALQRPLTPPRHSSDPSAQSQLPGLFAAACQFSLESTLPFTTIQLLSPPPPHSSLHTSALPTQSLVVISSTNCVRVWTTSIGQPPPHRLHSTAPMTPQSITSPSLSAPSLPSPREPPTLHTLGHSSLLDDFAHDDKGARNLQTITDNSMSHSPLRNSPPSFSDDSYRYSLSRTSLTPQGDDAHKHDSDDVSSVDTDTATAIIEAFPVGGLSRFSHDPALSPRSAHSRRSINTPRSSHLFDCPHSDQSLLLDQVDNEIARVQLVSALNIHQLAFSLT